MSIFNFDTLAEWPRPTRAVWFAFLLLAAFRVAHELWPGMLRYVPQDEPRYLTLRNDVRLQTQLEADHSAWLLGTSRLTGLDPTCIADVAGAEPSGVANLSAPGMTFWHAARLLREYPERASRLRVLVMDLLPFQIYDGDVFSESTPVFLALGNATDRAGIRGGRDRVVAIADTIFPAWSERRRMEEWGAGFAAMRKTRAERLARFSNYADFSAPGESRARAKDAGALAAYAGSGVVSQVQSNALHEILDRLPGDAQLVLIWLPVAPEFEQALDDPASAVSRSVQQMRDLLGEFDDKRVHVFGFDEQPETVHIDEHEFTDLVHFSEKGVSQVCELIGSAIRMSIR